MVSYISIFQISTFILKLEEILSVLKLLILSCFWDFIQADTSAGNLYPPTFTSHSFSCLSLCLTIFRDLLLHHRCPSFWTFFLSLCFHNTLYSFPGIFLPRFPAFPSPYAILIVLNTHIFWYLDLSGNIMTVMILFSNPPQKTHIQTLSQSCRLGVFIELLHYTKIANLLVHVLHRTWILFTCLLVPKCSTYSYMLNKL